MPSTNETHDSGPDVTLACRKIWGGNGHAAMSVTLPGLAGVLRAIPRDSELGGDLYYLSACGAGIMSRMCIADVRGHGAEVAHFATWLERVFSAHMNRHSPSGVLREVNRRATRRGLCFMATALCLSYNSRNGRLVFCNAGHPHLRVCRAGTHDWAPLEVVARDRTRPWNVPLAVTTHARYSVAKTRLQAGDKILIHTDGLTEAHDVAGRQLGETLWEPGRIPGNDSSPADIATALMGALRGHLVDPHTADDDVTFTVLEVLPHQRGNTLTLYFRNNFSRAGKERKRQQ